MIYAETPRLLLRSLEKADLPRIVDLIGDWDVARWLSSVPYPYNLKHAEEFYAKMTEAANLGLPEMFVMERKKDAAVLGAVGLHPAREVQPKDDHLIIGYWLGRDYWKQGYMTEAVASVIDLAFRRAGVTRITATTDPANLASQNVLRNAGLFYSGITPHRDADLYGMPLRGSADVTRWELTRALYARKAKAS